MDIPKNRHSQFTLPNHAYSPSERELRQCSKNKTNQKQWKHAPYIRGVIYSILQKASTLKEAYTYYSSGVPGVYGRTLADLPAILDNRLNIYICFGDVKF